MERAANLFGCAVFALLCGACASSTAGSARNADGPPASSSAAMTSQSAAPLGSGSRALALAAAHREATRLSQAADDDAGWPPNVDTVTALVHSGGVPYPNTGHECDSGTIIRRRRQERACLLRIRSNRRVSPDPEATILFQR